MATQPTHVQAYPHPTGLQRGDNGKAAAAVPASSSTLVEAPAQPSPVAVLLIPEGAPLPPARRLVVLVPNQDFKETELARRIWDLASPRRLDVFLLGLSPDVQQEPRARRRLATLAAITRSDSVPVDARLEIGCDWVGAVRALWQSGDLVICHAEQAVSVWGGRRRPLAHALAAALNAPVCVLTGFYPELPPDAKWIGKLVRNTVPFAIAAAFLVMQFYIEGMPKNWAYFTVMSFSVIVEFSLLGLWFRSLM